MFHKALWLRNWKQSKYVVVAFWIAMFYFLPFHYFSNLGNVMDVASRYNEAIEYDNYFRGAEVVFSGAAILIILAGMLIGRERANQANDFHFSLPFSRKEIFLSKWTFGVGSIIVGLGINVLLTIVLTHTTMIGEYEKTDHWPIFYLMTAIIFITIFSLALFIGTITGNIVSQFILSTVSLVFAHGFTLLIERAEIIHANRVYGLFTQHEFYKKIVNYFTPTLPLHDYAVTYDTYKGFYVNTIHLSSLTSAIGIIIITFSFGIIMYTRTKSENNGKVFLFPVLHIPFIACTTICFALFGGYFFASLFNSTLISYYIGFLGAGIGTFFLLKKMLTLKLNWKLK